MGTMAGSANGVTEPISSTVDISCSSERRNSAAKSIRLRSTSLVSLVRRLMRRPVGVVWKNDIGALRGIMCNTSYTQFMVHSSMHNELVNCACAAFSQNPKDTNCRFVRMAAHVLSLSQFIHPGGGEAHLSSLARSVACSESAARTDR